MMQMFRRTALDSIRARAARCAVFCLLAAVAQAQSPAPDNLDISLVAEVREDIAAPGGRRISRLVPATHIEQGQEIFYTVRVRNTAGAPVPDVEIIQRIPDNTVYVAGSATGPGVEVALSADGGQNFGNEGQLTIVDQSAVALMQASSFDRAALTRAATPPDYTHIRWRLRNPLAPGAVALLRFRAVFR